MPSSFAQRRPAFFPRADAAVLARKLSPPPTYPKAAGPIYDCGHTDTPLLPWTFDTENEHYPPQKEAYAPANIPDKDLSLSDRYLRATLAKDERLRLSMLWYYTRDIFTEIDFLSGLQEKVCIAQESTGWDFAIVGILDVNYYIRLATVGVPLGILPRGECLCAHTVTRPPGSVFLLPNLTEDWRFADSPYVEFAGLQAYAGAPLRLQDESGDTVCLGSLCVASSTPQDPLTKTQQTALIRLADWIVSDIIHLTRARRQRQRRKMADLISTVQQEIDEVDSEEPVIKILRTTYADAIISLQPPKAGHIEVEGRDQVAISEFSDGLWEDIDHIDEFIAKSNHMQLPSDRVVRVIAAPCESVLGHSFLTVGTMDFTLVFDDIDAWFVQTCANIISKMWQKRLLQEVMVAKEKFLRGFSHQLRTPIHGILGAADLLAEGLNSQSFDDTISQAAALLRSASVANSSEESRMYLDTIKRSGGDLISIINSMITLNRWADIATTERHYATYTVFELEKELATETLKVISGDARYNASLVFNHTLPPDYCSLRTDLALLRDSLLPLIVNAIQNTSQGIVVVTVSIDSKSKSLTVDVLDTGRGIPIGDQQRIFGLYEQVDTFSTGAGLGLTLASRFAALLGGSVDLVSSDIGHGSHFRAKFHGVEVVLSKTPLLAEPLVPQLAKLPDHFYTIPASSKGLSLSNHFATSLACYGLVPSNNIKGALVIVDFVADPEKLRVALSQSPSDQVVICLVPSPGETSLDATLKNVIYVHGPFLTPTLGWALERADELLSLLDANEADSIKATKELPVHLKVDDPESKGPTTRKDELPAVTESRNKVVPDAVTRPIPGTDEPSVADTTFNLPDASKPIESIENDQQMTLREASISNDSSKLITTRPLSASIENSYADVESSHSAPVAHELSHTTLIELHNSYPSTKVADTATASHPTALLVDDNPTNLRVLQMYCSKRNLPYICAKDGLEAVSLFRSHQDDAYINETKQPIQLIFMDLQMPVCDGIEATRRIRQLEKNNNWGKSVLFVITGQDSPADKKAVEDAGGQEYYVKPVSIKRLDVGLKGYFPRFTAGNRLG